MDKYVLLRCVKDMKESTGLGEQLPLPPNRLYERLAQIGTRYTWDQSIEPFHSVQILSLYTDVATDS